MSQLTVKSEATSTLTGIDYFYASDGIKLAYRFWCGKIQEPVIVYLHGIEGHSLWFERTAKELCSSGLNIYAPDRRGAALNKNPAEGPINYKAYIQDLVSFIQVVHFKHPDSPLILFGNCWGATVAAIYAASIQSTPLDGLILTCPAFGVLCDVDWKTKLEIFIHYLIGSKKQFILPLTPEMFTENPEFLKLIKIDSLRTISGTAQFLIETLKLRVLANNAAKQLYLPALVLQSGADAIVDQKAVDKWFSNLSSADKTCKQFIHAHHSIDFESNISEYTREIYQWIKDRNS